MENTNIPVFQRSIIFSAIEFLMEEGNEECNRKQRNKRNVTLV